MLGVDYSARPADAKTAQALATHGYHFACRYLSPPGNAKNLTPEEAKALSDAGLSIVCVWESTAGRTRDGAFAGRGDGKLAAQLADHCGMPKDRPIFVAIDFDAQAGDLPKIAHYLDAFREAGRPVGVYGGYRVVDVMLHEGHASIAWQTAAWSHDQHHSSAALYQRTEQVVIHGVPCDVNDALKPDFGQWDLRPKPAAPVAPKPAPQPIPAHQEDDVQSHKISFKTGHQGRAQVAYPGDLTNVVSVTFNGDATSDAPRWNVGGGHLNIFAAKPDATVTATVWTAV